MAFTVKRDKRRREKRRRETKYNNNGLDPVEVTRFMGTYHDQNQTVLSMESSE